jgi:hypothetical protein
MTFFRATSWSQFQYFETTFWGLKGALQVDLLFILYCYYTDRVTKTFSYKLQKKIQNFFQSF